MCCGVPRKVISVLAPGAEPRAFQPCVLGVEGEDTAAAVKGSPLRPSQSGPP